METITRTRIGLQWLNLTRTRKPFYRVFVVALLVILGVTMLYKGVKIKSIFYLEENIETSVALSMEDDKDYSNSDTFIFKDHRLQFVYDGYCISAETKINKTLTVDYCNPKVTQSFSLNNDGKLKFGQGSLCVSATPTVNSSKLMLTSCESNDLTRFSLNVAGSNLTLRHGAVKNRSLCLSTRTFTHRGSVSKDRNLGDPVIMTDCLGEFSHLNFLKESEFLWDRRALLEVAPQDPQCEDSPACATNRRPDHVKTVSVNEDSRCLNISECLTVVTKTARRPLLVLRMAQSIRDVYGGDLPIIAYDDGPGNYSEDVWGEIQRFPLMRYVITDNEDLGISKGRNLAIKSVETKYFMLVDDDNVFNNYTNIKRMIEILDTTDAALVGGKFTGYRDYSGMLKVTTEKSKNKTTLTLYKGSCTAANQSIVNFPECFRCDLTSNVFLARTANILDVGGWSEELRVAEHKDIFLRLKALGQKVVYCPEFQVFNKKATEKSELNSKGYNKLRKGARLRKMKNLFHHRWLLSTSVEKKASRFDYNLLNN